MLSSQLTMADLVAITGYTRHQLRGLLDLALPGRTGKGARIAREFRPQELIHVATMVELETRFGVNRSHVAKIAKRLGHVLSGPREQTRMARLVVSFEPPQVTYAAELIPTIDGVVMSLGPVFERVDRYVDSAGGATLQEQLSLGPTLLHAASRRGQE